MSNRLAARAAAISSSSLIGGAAGSATRVKGACGSVLEAMVYLLDEHDVENDDARRRDAAEQRRRAPPQTVARVGVGFGLVLARQPPDEAPQGLGFLRLG